MVAKKFVFEIEKAKEAKDGWPSVGPVYRNVLAKDGFRPLTKGVESCWDIFRISVEKYPSNPMLGQREIIDGKAGKYVWLTYKEVYDIVLKVGASICTRGIKKGARCGIYGVNCSNWVVCMQACNAYGLHCVPLYDTLGAGAVTYIISHAEISIIFAEETKISEVLKTFPDTGEYLKILVSFGKVTDGQKLKAENFGLEIYSWEEFLHLVKGLGLKTLVVTISMSFVGDHNICQFIFEPQPTRSDGVIERDRYGGFELHPAILKIGLITGMNDHFDLPLKTKSDVCTIMYTSGTTGEPKGVILSNESILSIISGVNHHLQSINEEFRVSDIFLSYLPLAHIFDRVIEELFISTGASIGFWRGDIKLLIDDLKELKPTVFCAVPRVLDRIYSGLVEKISSGGFLKHTLFSIGYSYKLRNMSKGYKHEEAAPMLDKIIFNKVKEGLGGNMRLILSGAAPLSPSVETFLRVVTCAHVLQGYGLTETCAGSFVAQPNELSMSGTVGPPLPNVDVCLESVPELGYDALASTPRGEICLRGNSLFSGYYKREDLTKEVMVDGWFHTGDIGEWQPDGSMKIIDRKKNIFKLSQGEYVSVENLESIYSLVTRIDSIWIYGNSYESFLVAVVNPNKESLECWAEENGVDGDFCTICENPKTKAYILKELTNIGKEKKLKGFEFIKAVHLDPIPFDMDRDLLTPTFKKKRAHFLKYYQKAIDGMYKSTR